MAGAEYQTYFGDCWGAHTHYMGTIDHILAQVDQAGYKSDYLYLLPRRLDSSTTMPANKPLQVPSAIAHRPAPC